LVTVFRSPRYEEVSFADWLAHTPPDLVAATFNLGPAVVARLPRDRPARRSLAAAALTRRRGNIIRSDQE